jgi:signal transduction histidine kinase
VGTVAVLIGRPPFGPILREMAPTLALVGGVVLVAGSALIALFVFAPARKRLKLLEHATVQFGSGNLSARAPENGGDEVAALARSFNQMGAELARRADALTAADTARRQLLADVSHELLTPLTAMRGYLETLQMPDLPLDQPTRDRYLGIVSDETHRLEHIVEDLLDLARLEGGGTKMKREPVSVGALFERVLARHEGQARSRTVTLDAQVEPGGEQLEGDPDRLEQALQNLAANAMRHTPDGGTVRLQSTRLPGGLVRLRVRDTGSGIPDAHLPLIFDRFYKADASRKAAGGSGLGLSIVKAIVERHGGTIAASNDNGAVFDLVLPVTDTTVSPSGDEPRPTA